MAYMIIERFLQHMDRLEERVKKEADSAVKSLVKRVKRSITE